VARPSRKSGRVAISDKKPCHVCTMTTDTIARWTAWMSMAALAGAIALRQRGTNDQAAKCGDARWLWTLGCVLLWIHVGCAFHFQHHWSHAAAYVHTAEQTAAKAGIDWGGGVYFNYVLMLVWASDAAWWWIAPESFRQRPAAVNRLIVGFILFMAFNATVVFGSGPPRWVALITCLGLATLKYRSSSNKAQRQSDA
jgi:hypothetical protein